MLTSTYENNILSDNNGTSMNKRAPNDMDSVHEDSVITYMTTSNASSFSSTDHEKHLVFYRL